MSGDINFEKIKKSSRTSVLISSLGLLLIIGALVYSFFKLNSLQKDISVLSDLRLSLRRDVDSLKQVKDSLSVRLTVSNAINLSDKNVSKEELEKNISDSTAGYVPRIYIHINNEGQRADARKTGMILQKHGFIVPGIEYVGNKSPNQNQIRYFRKTAQEENDISQITGYLEKSGIRLEKRLIKINNLDQIKPRQYEIWFAPDYK